MQVAQRQSYLSSVELSQLLRETLLFTQVPEKFSSLDEPHHKVNTLFALEHILHAYNEGVVNVEKDVFFKFNIFELLVVYDYILANSFHRV